jgi:hypothetical protein
MKERPILFSAPMVRAILEGRKTQTRRVIKPQPFMRPWQSANGEVDDACFWRYGEDREDWPSATTCPYGAPGERLWVRETFCIPDQVVSETGAHVVYRADVPDLREERSVVRLAKKNGTPVIAWQPSIYMPREFSRITLEVTGVRVERLHEISETDCEAEGIDGALCAQFTTRAPSRASVLPAAVHAYFGLWESINDPGSWSANPWVWVVEFKRAA